jgi:hypothetical protein
VRVLDQEENHVVLLFVLLNLVTLIHCKAWCRFDFLLKKNYIDQLISRVGSNCLLSFLSQTITANVNSNLYKTMTEENSGSSGKDYTVTSSGTNSQGNHYCHRETDNSSGYHYSNKDGSYYYSNPNGSKYYNSGGGYSQYTSPSGKTSKSYGK